MRTLTLVPLAPAARRVAIVLALAALVLALLLSQETRNQSAGSAGGSPISARCTGEEQGQIKGSSTIKGREGTLSITSLAHGITSPRDAASGQATGRRQHKPIRITMEVDRATPLLINALVNNETLTACTFNFWRPSSGATAGGAEKNYFRIQIGGGRVVDYDLTGRPGGGDTVTFALVYQKISWTWTDGGITAEDDWYVES